MNGNEPGKDPAAERLDAIGDLTEEELRAMLTLLCGYTPDGFDWALTRVRPS